MSRFARAWLCALSLGWAPGALADDSSYVAPVDKLVQATMKSDPAPDNVDLVWWLPMDFWKSALSANPDVAPSQAQKVIDSLSPYTMVAVVQGQMGPLGAVQFRDPAEVLAELTVRTPAGATLSPIPDDKLSGDAYMLAQIMKPMLAGMLGPMGEHLQFVFFDNSAAAGAPIDPRSEGQFVVQVGSKAFTWDLPIEVLFPPVDCKKCSRELSGAWSYCPYDGSKVSK